MKIQIDYFGCQKNADWNKRIEESLQGFHAENEISSAHVRVEQRRENSLAYLVTAELKIHGPDIHAEAEGNTFDEAFLKLQKPISNAYRLRKEKQQRLDSAELGVKATHRG